jgi:hypothetical protein
MLFKMGLLRATVQHHYPEIIPSARKTPPVLELLVHNGRSIKLPHTRMLNSHLQEFQKLRNMQMAVRMTKPISMRTTTMMKRRRKGIGVVMNIRTKT